MCGVSFRWPVELLVNLSVVELTQLLRSHRVLFVVSMVLMNFNQVPLHYTVLLTYLVAFPPHKSWITSWILAFGNFHLCRCDLGFHRFFFFFPASPWIGLLTFIFLQLSNRATSIAPSRRAIPWRAGSGAQNGDLCLGVIASGFYAWRSMSLHQSTWVYISLPYHSFPLISPEVFRFSRFTKVSSLPQCRSFGSQCVLLRADPTTDERWKMKLSQIQLWRSLKTSSL